MTTAASSSKYFRKCLVAALLFLLCIPASVAEAGFGITPPYLRNTSLTRNSVYEQQILLVRGSPDTDLMAQVVIDAPGINEWFEIVEGTEILLPEGQQKIPMTVRVTVPNDAPYRDYGGKIRIRTNPPNDQVQQGTVSISLGAQVDISLSVIDRVIKDFRVRRISVADTNEGHKLAWLYFPGKIPFTMLIENTGNIDIAPSRVDLNIYDRTGTILVEETTSIGKMKTNAPYSTDEIIANIPTRLPAGNYTARYVIYNEEEIKQEGELSLSIVAYGTLQAAGFGFSGLSTAHKISVILPILGILILLLNIVYVIRRRRYNI